MTVISSKATMKQAKVRFNYDDYRQLPEGKRYEILDGELFVIPAPGIRHQRLTGDIFSRLLHHVREQRTGEVFIAPCDVVLSEEVIVQPDIAFVRRERQGIVGELNIGGPPDLVVEILSPGSRSKDLEIKRKMYARFVVPEYWIVDPDAETVEVLVWSESGYVRDAVHGLSDRLSSPLLPGLDLPLREIFAQT